ncbi:acyl-CoA thioesterase [Bacillus sp. UNC41MFS5]|uniref:acyl-CoA thioesterase n=1 Tax=Bacillus sp. UNC41MFS5 TaxID=1449046 RepID=UPI00068981A0|nr:acyl-CoA thioesterase [Bacillus sp. UNC41MFS5]
MRKSCSESKTIQTDGVLPNDTNPHQTLFGGALMSRIDRVAGIAAIKHSGKPTVTASTDSVDFLHPITLEDAVTLEAFVTWTGTTSMEVFVKVTADNFFTKESRVAATSFLTFVSLDKEGHPAPVPSVYPETEEEHYLFDTGEARSIARKLRREQSKHLAQTFGRK